MAHICRNMSFLTAKSTYRKLFFVDSNILNIIYLNDLLIYVFKVLIAIRSNIVKYLFR
jgi:hypothetical protein